MAPVQVDSLPIQAAPTPEVIHRLLAWLFSHHLNFSYPALLGDIVVFRGSFKADHINVSRWLSQKLDMSLKEVTEFLRCVLSDLVVVHLAGSKVISLVGDHVVARVPLDFAHDRLPFPKVGLLLWHLALREAQLVEFIYSLCNVSALEVSWPRSHNSLLRFRIGPVTIFILVGVSLHDCTT